MTEKGTVEGPLRSEELEQDKRRSDADPMLVAEDAPGHSLPASESGFASSEEGQGRRPNPIAGTMLPPDQSPTCSGLPFRFVAASSSS